MYQWPCLCMCPKPSRNSSSVVVEERTKTMNRSGTNWGHQNRDPFFPLHGILLMNTIHPTAGIKYSIKWTTLSKKTNIGPRNRPQKDMNHLPTINLPGYFSPWKIAGVCNLHLEKPTGVISLWTSTEESWKLWRNDVPNQHEGRLLKMGSYLGAWWFFFWEKHTDLSFWCLGWVFATLQKDHGSPITINNVNKQPWYVSRLAQTEDLTFEFFLLILLSPPNWWTLDFWTINSITQQFLFFLYRRIDIPRSLATILPGLAVRSAEL